MLLGVYFTSLMSSIGGMNTVLPKDIPSFGVLMMVVESAVSLVAPKSAIGVQLVSSGDCEGRSM